MIIPTLNTISINGEELAGIYVDSSFSFNKPEKDVSTFAVPGRNGDLIIDYGTFRNVRITYPCFVKGAYQGVGFLPIYDSIVQKLAALSGYQRIEEARDPDHFRLGAVVYPKAPNPGQFLRDGSFDLAFDCKPQRYLKTGERKITFEADGKIHNPTGFTALPLIRVHGNGKVTIGDVQITVTGNLNNWVDIDCEMMDCYRQSINYNSYISFTSNDFPVLKPGDNQVDLGIGISKVEITPRWWEL